MYTQVAWVQPCANHMQHIERLSCSCVMLRATWYVGAAQLLSLTELKSHLFELYFIGWTIKPRVPDQKCISSMIIVEIHNSNRKPLICALCMRLCVCVCVCVCVFVCVCVYVCVYSCVFVIICVAYYEYVYCIDLQVSLCIWKKICVWACVCHSLCLCSKGLCIGIIIYRPG